MSGTRVLFSRSARVSGWVVVVLGAALTVLSVVSLAVTHAAYEVRSERTNARAFLETFDGDANYLFRYSVSSFEGRSLAVTYIEPLTEYAEPPAGLKGWLAPGEVAASRAVADSTEIRERFGPITQVIGKEGLGSPTEPLIYVRPLSSANDTGMLPAESFGQFFSLELASEDIRSQPEGMMLGLQVAFLVVPSAVLLAVGISLSTPSIRRRTVMLEVLGADPVRAWRLSTARLAGALGFGALLAGVVSALVSSIGLRIGDFRISGATLTSHWQQMLGFWGLGCLVIFALAAAQTVPWGAQEKQRVRVKQKRYSALIAFSVFFLILGLGWLMLSIARVGQPRWIYLLFLGAVVVAAGSTTMVGWALQRISQFILGLGKRTSNAVLLITGAEGTHGRGRGAFAGAAVVISIFISVQVATYAMMLGSSNTEALEYQAKFADKVVAVELGNAPETTPQAVDAFLDDLPSGTQNTMVTQSLSGSDTNLAVEWRQWTLPGSQVNANSETLIREALFGAFGTHPVEAAQRETALDTIVEEVAKDSGYTLFIAGQSGQTLDTNVYTALASKHSKPAWRVGLPGENWVVALGDSAHQARWVTWFGVFAVTMLLSATLIRLSKDLIEESRELGILSAALGQTQLVANVIRLRLTLLMAIALALAATLTYPYASVVSVLGFPSNTPRNLLLILSAVVLLVGGLAALITPAIVGAGAKRWRPGQESL